MPSSTFLKYHRLNISTRFLAIIFVGLLAVAHAAAGQMIQTHPSHVISYGMFNACAWSPDGTKIALAHSGAVSLLDAQNLQRLDTFFTTHWGASGQLLNPTDITSIAISPDGQRLAVASGPATVFSMAGKIIFSIDTGSWHSVVFSHNGQYLATGAVGGSVDLWNAATGEHVKTFSGHTQVVYCLAFSNDDSQLLTGADDNKAILWDVSGGTAVRTFTDHTDGVFFTGFMPDGTTPITASYDDTVRRWDPAGPVVLTMPGYVESLAVSAKYIAGYTSMGSIIIWDTATNDYVGELVPNIGDDYASNATPRQVAFSPDGTRLVSGSARSKYVRLWDTTQWSKTVVFTGHTYGLNATAFPRTGRTC